MGVRVQVFGCPDVSTQRPTGPQRQQQRQQNKLGCAHNYGISTEASKVTTMADAFEKSLDEIIGDSRVWDGCVARAEAEL